MKYTIKYQSLFAQESYDLYYFTGTDKRQMFWRREGKGLPFLEKKNGKILNKYEKTKSMRREA